MAFIKKLALGSIFISILSIFAMSHNANAVTLTYNLNNYTNQYTVNNPRLNCTFLATDSISSNLVGNNVFTCNYLQSNVTSGSANAQGLVSIQTTGQYSLKQGDLIEFYFTIQGSSYVDIPISFTNVFQNFIVLDYSVIDDFSLSNYQGEITDMAGNTHTLIFDEYGSFYRVYRVVLRVIQDGTYNIGLTSSAYIFRTDTNNFGQRFYFTIKGISVYRFVGDEANKEQEEKTQEAVDESQSAGSSSSSSASQGGANLLTAITGFFNVITSAQPTNCRFNAPLNTYFGNQRLNVDLCSLDLPNGIGALTSIIAIGILIPFAIHMFNKFIALFRSFQS